MNRTSLRLTLMLAATLLATIGCSTKNYVRQQTTPLINKTNELDDLTAKNSRDIKDVDQRAQAGIQDVQTVPPRQTRRRWRRAAKPIRRNCRRMARPSGWTL